jgi:hypothetical protein
MRPLYFWLIQRRRIRAIVETYASVIFLVHSRKAHSCYRRDLCIRYIPGSFKEGILVLPLRPMHPLYFWLIQRRRIRAIVETYASVIFLAYSTDTPTATTVRHREGWSLRNCEEYRKGIAVVAGVAMSLYAWKDTSVLSYPPRLDQPLNV